MCCWRLLTCWRCRRLIGSNDVSCWRIVGAGHRLDRTHCQWPSSVHEGGHGSARVLVREVLASQFGTQRFRTRWVLAASEAGRERVSDVCQHRSKLTAHALNQNSKLLITLERARKRTTKCVHLLPDFTKPNLSHWNEWHEVFSSLRLPVGWRNFHLLWD